MTARHDKATERELAEALVDLARWSEVATRNGELHARIASALALAELGAGSSAAVVDGAEQVFGHHETVGERQGGQPVPDKATVRRRARVRSVTHGESTFSLSSDEWESIVTARHDKATELAATVREALKMYGDDEREAIAALDALEAQATGKVTEGRTGAAAVDQAIADVRAKAERELKDIYWTRATPYPAATFHALRVLADAVEEFRADAAPLWESVKNSERRAVAAEAERDRLQVALKAAEAAYDEEVLACANSEHERDRLAHQWPTWKRRCGRSRRTATTK